MKTLRGSFFLFIFVLPLVLSCTEEPRIEKSKGLVPPEQMVSFLVDMHLAEAKMSYGDIRDADSLEIVFRHYERHLFDKYGIQDSAYYRSYEYYLSNMDQLQNIYGAVVDSLSVLNSMEKNKDFGISNNK